ncbi:MAG TPA: hypothetical protein VGN52_11240 [Burkholderiales bacterium]
MDTRRITDPVVRAAFEAWQKPDLNAWLAHFAPGATLLDDGAPRDLQAFSREIGKERFLGIDRVENHGRDIYGPFHSDTWGDFNTYFKFRLNAQGQIERLEIGQAG